jgi:CRISPR-associated protein (TIGR03985 family)
MQFVYPPTADTLQILARGRLADRLLRSVRLWFILRQLYGPKGLAKQLPEVFRYRDFCDRIFAPTHHFADSLTVQEITRDCELTDKLTQAERCLCQWSLETCLSEGTEYLNLLEWQQDIMAQTGLGLSELTQMMPSQPFATVHRTLRDDLKHLVELGWLKSPGLGQYRCIASTQRLQLPLGTPPKSALSELSVTQSWELLRTLQNMTFIQPELAVIAQSLQSQLAQHTQALAWRQEPMQRIFPQFDYILSENTQDRVDTLQSEIEQIWQQNDSMIEFDYWRKDDPTHRSLISVTTYPVCLHYVRRAKYLSAYGIDPWGQLGWHNYRLDRVESPHIRAVPWQSAQVPEKLRIYWQKGTLPKPEEVASALEEAWGFNFYLPKQLLIMRFPADFARWYVEDTQRHITFQEVAYRSLPNLICRKILDPSARKEILQVIRQCSPNDAYYQAWIRLGDTNITMRLREWRPNGEVIAPLAIRQQMQKEAEAELQQYLKLSIMNADNNRELDL